MQINVGENSAQTSDVATEPNVSQWPETKQACCTIISQTPQTEMAPACPTGQIYRQWDGDRDEEDCAFA